MNLHSTFHYIEQKTYPFFFFFLLTPVFREKVFLCCQTGLKQSYLRLLSNYRYVLTTKGLFFF